MAIPALGLALGKALIPSLIGRLVSGKGEVAEKIASAALEITGLDDSASERDVMAALEKDPEAMVRLKEIAANEAADRLDAEIAQAQLEVADRKSAREMKIKADDGAVTKLMWIALINLTATFVAILVCTVISTFWGIEIPTIWASLIGVAFGNASAKLDMVFNFYLGSSKGSKDKDQKLGDIARGQP